MPFIRIPQVYTADPANVWVAKKSFTPTDPFAIVMHVETDLAPNTAFEGQVQIVNPRIGPSNWFVSGQGGTSVGASGSHSHGAAANVTYADGHSHGAAVTVFPSGVHSHTVSTSLVFHGVTRDFRAPFSILAPYFGVWWWFANYSVAVAAIQGSDQLKGVFFVRGIVEVAGAADQFDHSGEFWYRVAS